MRVVLRKNPLVHIKKVIEKRMLEFNRNLEFLDQMYLFQDYISRCFLFL